MPLKLSKLETPGDLAVLNRWADGIEQSVQNFKPVSNLTSGVTFQTNNVANNTQSMLNIKAGNGISALADTFGNTTIAYTGIFAPIAHQFLTSLSASNVFSAAQPAFTDLSGTLALAQIGATGTPSSSTFLRGDYTWAVPPSGSATQAIQAYYSTIYSGPNVPLSANTPATVLSQVVIMPSSGGPFRVYLSYGISLTGTSSEQMMAKADDGTNVFATTGNNETGSFTFGFMGASGISPVTYANSAVVTFTVTIECNNGSMSYSQNGAFAGFQGTYLQVSVLTSV